MGQLTVHRHSSPFRAPQEFERFKADWLQADFPAWLEQRKPGIDYYRSLTGKLVMGGEVAVLCCTIFILVAEASAATAASQVGGMRMAGDSVYKLACLSLLTQAAGTGSPAHH